MVPNATNARRRADVGEACKWPIDRGPLHPFLFFPFSHGRQQMPVASRKICSVEVPRLFGKWRRREQSARTFKGGPTRLEYGHGSSNFDLPVMLRIAKSCYRSLRIAILHAFAGARSRRGIAINYQQPEFRYPGGPRDGVPRRPTARPSARVAPWHQPSRDGDARGWALSRIIV